jgi:uncharacterized protein (DUF2141 family)
LDITLVSSGSGASIAYLVFSSPDGFPDNHEKAIRHGFVPVATLGAGHQQIDLGSLPVGRYAIALYLDLNGNHKLDHGLLGIPKEPVGVSNNPKRLMGPPHFDECSFVHGPIPQVIPITLVR